MKRSVTQSKVETEFKRSEVIICELCITARLSYHLREEAEYECVVIGFTLQYMHFVFVIVEHTALCKVLGTE